MATTQASGIAVSDVCVELPEFMGKPLEKKHGFPYAVWYIYLQNWVFFGANVGKYSIHGAYGFRRKC